MLGYDVAFGKTRQLDGPRYQVVFRYENEPVAVACARVAVRQLKKLWAGEGENFAAEIEGLRGLAARTDPGPSTRAILREAERRGIPVTRPGGGSLLQLGYGKYARRVQASLTDSPSCVAVDAVSDKQLTKRVLSALGIRAGGLRPHRRGGGGRGEEIGYPVVEAVDGNTKRRSTGLQNARQVGRVTKGAAGQPRRDLEKHIEGRDYRVLVVGGRVSAVAERTPPQSSATGRARSARWWRRKPKPDAGRRPFEAADQKSNWTRPRSPSARGRAFASSVPAEGTRVVLRRNANLSPGGTARAIEGIHPKNAEFAVRAANAVGLDVAASTSARRTLPCRLMRTAARSWR